MAGLVAVVPAYNEEATVAAVVRDLRREFPEGLRVVVVDDGSGDATAHVAASSGADVLRLPCNMGIGAALRLGFRYACEQDGWDTTVVVDGDGQHLASQVSALLAGRAAGADLVIGSRFHPDNPEEYEVSRSRRWAMRLAGRVLRRRWGLHLTDPTSGFWAMSRPCAELLSRRLPSGFMEYNLRAMALVVGAGMRIAEVPTVMASRQGGRPSARGLALAYHYLHSMLAALTAERRQPQPDPQPPQSPDTGPDSPDPGETT